MNMGLEIAAGVLCIAPPSIAAGLAFVFLTKWLFRIPDEAFIHLCALVGLVFAFAGFLVWDWLGYPGTRSVFRALNEFF